MQYGREPEALEGFSRDFGSDKKQRHDQKGAADLTHPGNIVARQIHPRAQKRRRDKGKNKVRHADFGVSGACVKTGRYD